MSGKNILGDAEVEQKYLDEMKMVARAIQELFNPGVKVKDSKVGFVLMLFEVGIPRGGRMNYMSNAEREDVKIALKEQLSFFEGMPSSSSSKSQ